MDTLAAEEKKTRQYQGNPSTLRPRPPERTPLQPQPKKHIPEVVSFKGIPKPVQLLSGVGTMLAGRLLDADFKHRDSYHEPWAFLKNMG